MTEEKKKPEEDEVTDQQLDGVAGGIAIFPAATKDGSGTVSTGPLDVCKVPILGVPVPTPFPNIAVTDGTDTTTKTDITTKGDTTQG